MDYLGAFGWAAIIAGGLVFIGIAAFFIFGWPLLTRIAEKLGGIYNPSEDSSRVSPQYSTAEARVKAGRYEEAIAEYRKVIEQFPVDIYGHIRIAEIAVERLNDPKLAELELLSATAKATTEEATALVAHRLADFYQNTL